MFDMKMTRLHWICDDDLCLHGDVTIKIGEEDIYVSDITLSASALYLLKTLTEDHRIGESNQMVPCCGNFIVPDEDFNNVKIYGCPNGEDWSVIHKNGHIELIRESGQTTEIPYDRYEEVVHSIVNQVKDYYMQSVPRSMPEEVDEQEGYVSFWNEWAIRNHQLSNKEFYCPLSSREINSETCTETKGDTLCPRCVYNGNRVSGKI